MELFAKLIVIGLALGILYFVATLTICLVQLHTLQFEVLEPFGEGENK